MRANVMLWLSLAALCLSTAWGCSKERAEQRETSAAWTRLRSATSDTGDLRVVVHTDSMPVPINVTHQWRVQVRREASETTPFIPQALVVNGGMPSHGHGLPTQPSASQHLGDGTFLVSGMRFNMGGPWEMVIRILDGNRWHRVAFPIDLDPAEGRHGHHSTWSGSELGVLQSLSWSSAGKPPRDRTNRVQEDPRAVALGRALFFDPSISGTGEVSCASCHQEELAFTDGRATAKGIAVLDRNAPSVIGGARQRWFYWDGRRDSLWAQALVPMEAAREMGSSRLAVVRRIRDDGEHRAAYEDLFGPLPVLDGLSMPHAGPIGPEAHRRAWRKIPVRTRRTINAAFANLGKAIAAFESTLDFGPARFDHYVDAGAKGNVLSEREMAGLKLFLDPKNQCLKCHNGPAFTNGGFHNIGTGSADPEHPDVGRIAGLQSAILDEFNCLGRYSDDRVHCNELEHLAPEAHLAGAFKVPSLRGVHKTAPYMHDGRFESLREVLEFYRAPPPKSPAMPHELIALPHLTDEDLNHLEAFLQTLGG
ncbi:MAG: cytochrome c peroxidase [Myxococcota bacterium]